FDFWFHRRCFRTHLKWWTALRCPRPLFFFDFDQNTGVGKVVNNTTTTKPSLWRWAMLVVFDIDWTIVASADGLLISLLARYWCKQRQRDLDYRAIPARFPPPWFAETNEPSRLAAVGQFQHHQQF